MPFFRTCQSCRTKQVYSLQHNGGETKKLLQNIEFAAALKPYWEKLYFFFAGQTSLGSVVYFFKSELLLRSSVMMIFASS